MRNWIIICFLMSSIGMFAQDLGIYSHYIAKPILINPGATGYNGGNELFINYRNQWTGIDRAPQNYTAVYNGAFFDNVGLGLQFNTETFGALNRLRAQFAYAYHIKGDNLKLGIGLGAEYHQFSLSSEAALSPLLDPRDPLVIDAANNTSYIDLTLGAYGEINEKFIVGLSIPNLVRARLDEQAVENDESTSFQYFTALFGYRHQLKKYDVTLTPSIAVKRVYQGPEDVHVDLNLLASFLDEKFLGGFTYQVGGFNSLGFLVGLNWSNFQFMYGYSASLNELQPYGGGAHELTVGFRLL